MTWKLRVEQPDGSTAEILVDDPTQVAEQVREFRAKGRKVKIEDVQGRYVDGSRFGLDPVEDR